MQAKSQQGRTKMAANKIDDNDHINSSDHNCYSRHYYCQYKQPATTYHIAICRTQSMKMIKKLTQSVQGVQRGAILRLLCAVLICSTKQELQKTVAILISHQQVSPAFVQIYDRAFCLMPSRCGPFVCAI